MINLIELGVNVTEDAREPEKPLGFDISNQKLYVDVVFYIFIQLQQRERWVTGWATMREVS